MMLRNGGALCCGETVEEAFFYAKNLVAACEAQVRDGDIRGIDRFSIPRPSDVNGVSASLPCS